jgi:hypothetical protein
MARARDVLLKLTGDPRSAREAIREVRDDLKDFGGLTAEAIAQVKTEAAEAKIKVLSARLERLGQQEQTPEVKIQTARAVEQIERLQRKLHSIHDVEVDVDVKRGAGERVAAGIAGAVTVGLSALAAIPGLGRVFGSLASGAAQIGSSGAAAAAGLAAMGAAALALLAVIALLLPVLVALGASLAAAVAGAAVLGAAFGAALAGPFLIAAAAVAKLVTIFKAFDAQGKASVQTQAGVQAAAQQTAAAQQALADAYANLRDQAQKAAQAQQDAARAVVQDELNVTKSHLGREQAALNTQKAEKALRDALKGTAQPQALFEKATDVASDQSGIAKATSKLGATPGVDQLDVKQKILDLKEARVAEKQATIDQSNATTQLGRDRKTEADFIKNGKNAYAPYVAAIRQVRDAQRGVAAATRATTVAQAAQNKGLTQLTPREERIARSLKRIKDSVEGAFGPVVDKALEGIVGGLQSLASVLDDKRIRTGLRGIGDALGEAFRRIGRFLSDKESRDALNDFLKGGRKLAKPLTDLFIAFASVVRDLARDAMPALIARVKQFTGQVRGFEKEHGGAKKLGGTVKELIASFDDWVKVAKGLSLIVLAFLRGGKRTGDSFAGSLGDILVKYGKFLNTTKGQKGIRDFFHDVLRDVQGIAKALKDIVDLGAKVGHVVKSLAPLEGTIGPKTSNSLLDKLRNQTIPGPIGLLPKIPEDLSLLDKLAGILTGHKHAAGGLFTRETHIFGEAGMEAVLPLERPQVMAKLGSAIAASMPQMQPALAGVHGGTHIDNFNVHVKAPKGELPDVQTTATRLTRLMERRAGGSVRQD